MTGNGLTVRHFCAVRDSNFSGEQQFLAHIIIWKYSREHSFARRATGQKRASDTAAAIYRPSRCPLFSNNSRPCLRLKSS